MAEGINWSKVDFVDNQDTLNLIERVRLNKGLTHESYNIPETTGFTCNSGWGM